MSTETSPLRDRIHRHLTAAVSPWSDDSSPMFERQSMCSVRLDGVRVAISTDPEVHWSVALNGLRQFGASPRPLLALSVIEYPSLQAVKACVDDKFPVPAWVLDAHQKPASTLTADQIMEGLGTLIAHLSGLAGGHQSESSTQVEAEIVRDFEIIGRWIDHCIETGAVVPYLRYAGLEPGQLMLRQAIANLEVNSLSGRHLAPREARALRSRPLKLGGSPEVCDDIRLTGLDELYGRD